MGLLAAAEDQRTTDVPETNAIGLLAAHAACEAMLGLIVGTVPYKAGRAREPSFIDLLEMAAPRARPRLSQTLRGELFTMNRTRDGFIHGGASVAVIELDRAIDNAHALAGHVPMPGNRQLVGIASVVADIIELDAIGVWLRHADDMRRKARSGSRLTPSPAHWTRRSIG